MKKFDRSLRWFVKNFWPLKVFLYILRLGLLGLGLLGFTVVLYVGRIFFYFGVFALFFSRVVALWKFPDLFYSSLVGTLYYLVKLAFRINVLGKENIPEQGRAIIVARHRDVLDIPLMAFAAWHKRKVKFIAREDLAWLNYLKPARDYFIPINRENITKSQLEGILEALDSGKFLGIFPEGSRDPEKNNSDGEATSYGGVLRIAEKKGAPLIPLNIDAGEAYGNSWLKQLWKRFGRFEVELKVGEEISVSEIKTRYCRKHDKEKVTKEEYPRVVDYFLEEIVDQV